MSRVFDIFTSEYVIMTLSKNRRQSIEHAGHLKTVESPSEVVGYFTEEDDDYYYLGFEPGKINIAVQKFQVILIELADPNAAEEEILNELLGDIPGDKEGMN